MWFITGEDENFDICVLTPSPGNLSLQHKYAAKWVTPLRCFQMAVGNLASLECGQKKIAKVSGRKGRQLGKCLVERVICEFLMTEIFMSGFYGHVGH